MCLRFLKIGEDFYSEWAKIVLSVSDSTGIFMMKIFFLILLFLPGKVWAQNEVGFGDYAIAGTIKTLARIFVQTADLDRIKNKQIKALSRMDEAKFRKRYGEICPVFKDVPPELLSRYEITGHMTKEEAIKDIRLLNKSDLLQIIDKIPDHVIVKYMNGYLRQKAYQLKENTWPQQIDSLFKKFIQKAG